MSFTCSKIYNKISDKTYIFIVESTGSLIKAVSLPIIRLLDALSGEKKSRRNAETDRLTTADERFLDEQLGFVTTAIGDIITQIGFGKIVTIFQHAKRVLYLHSFDFQIYLYE